MRLFKLAAVAVLPLTLAALRSRGPDQGRHRPHVGGVAGGIIGNQVGKGSGNVLATVAGAMIGGIVGSEIGRSMDEQDRRLGEQAEFAALEEVAAAIARGAGATPTTAATATSSLGGRTSAATRLPRLYAHRLYRRPPAGHARHRLPQSGWHVEQRRLTAARRRRADFRLDRRCELARRGRLPKASGARDARRCTMPAARGVG